MESMGLDMTDGGIKLGGFDLIPFLERSPRMKLNALIGGSIYNINRIFRDGKSKDIIFIKKHVGADLRVKSGEDYETGRCAVICYRIMPQRGLSFPLESYSVQLNDKAEHLKVRHPVTLALSFDEKEPEYGVFFLQGDALHFVSVSNILNAMKVDLSVTSLERFNGKLPLDPILPGHLMVLRHIEREFRFSGYPFRFNIGTVSPKGRLIEQGVSLDHDYASRNLCFHLPSLDSGASEWLTQGHPIM